MRFAESTSHSHKEAEEKLHLLLSLRLLTCILDSQVDREVAAVGAPLAICTKTCPSTLPPAPRFKFNNVTMTMRIANSD